MGYAAKLLPKVVEELDKLLKEIEEKSKENDLVLVYLQTKELWNVYEAACDSNEIGTLRSDPIRPEIKTLLMRAKEAADKFPDRNDESVLKVKTLVEDAESYERRWAARRNELQPTARFN